MIPEVQVGQIWRHRNGNEYMVVCISNLLDLEKYPKTITYMNRKNRTLWSREYSDWHRSFTPVFGESNYYE